LANKETSLQFTEKSIILIIALKVLFFVGNPVDIFQQNDSDFAPFLFLGEHSL